MIEIKRCNYITGNPSDVSYAVKKIVDFLDMEGRNPVLFCKPRSSNSTATTLKYLMEPKINFNNIEDFTEVLNNKGNFFEEILSKYFFENEKLIIFQ